VRSVAGLVRKRTGLLCQCAVDGKKTVGMNGKSWPFVQECVIQFLPCPFPCCPSLTPSEEAASLSEFLAVFYFH
jgi:hypothetical protein